MELIDLTRNPTRLVVSNINFNHLSSKNKYMPLYSLYKGKTYKVDNKFIIIYNDKIANATIYGRSFTGTNVKNSFVLDSYLKKYVYTYTPTSAENDFIPTTTVQVNIGKGLIIDENYDFLALMVVDTRYINDNMSTPNPNKFKLLISNKIKEGKYKKLHNIVKKSLIFTAESDGIDVIYTNDIDGYCFNRTNMLPQFRTTQERDEYFSYLDNLIDGQ